jgi:purine-binding chemotaxis protein CheW
LSLPIFVTGADSGPALIVTVGACACAIPMRHVVETMRPLPIESVPEMPDFVRGVSLIRGAPVPVIDLGVLLEIGEPSASYGRFVTLRLGERRVALGVDAVIGSRNLDPAQLEQLPPLLHDGTADRIEAIGTRDAQLLLVLRAARIVPDAVWATLEKAGATG